MENKALFLDRDGTINIDYGYVYQADKFVFIEGIFDLCQKAQEKGYLIIVITNQSGIARGYYTENDFEIVTKHMISEFAKNGIKITDVFHCPFLDGEDRKPNPGMFLKAQKKYNINMSKSLSLGDKDRDFEAAQKAGVKNNFLFDGKNYKEIEEYLIKN